MYKQVLCDIRRAETTFALVASGSRCPGGPPSALAPTAISPQIYTMHAYHAYMWGILQRLRVATAIKHNGVYMGGHAP